MSWTARGPGGTLINSPPTSFEVTVPTGKERLFQVLAVYADPDTLGMSFFYGDSLKDLAGSQVELPITVKNVGVDGAFTGTMSGQYLTSTNQGPTGTVLIKYKPASKPALIVEHASMVNGWFEAMGLYGASLEYSLENGTKLFDGSAIDLKTLATSSRIAKVVIPRHDANKMASPMNDWVAQEPKALVYGWFSPASAASLVSAKRVCRADSLGTLTSLATPQLSPAGSIRNNILTVGTSAPASIADLIASPVGTQVSIQGGVTRTSDTICSNSGNVFKEYVNFENSAMLDSYGNYRSKISSGVFEMRGIGSAVDIDFNAPTTGKARFTVKPLPGMEAKVDSVVLLKTSDPAALSFHEDDISCDAALSGAFGYAEVDSKIHLSYAESQLSGDMNYSSRLSSAFLICAKKNGKSVSAGLVLPADHFAAFPVPISFSAANSQISVSGSTVPVTGSVSVTVDLKGSDNNPYFEPVSSASLVFAGCTSAVTTGPFTQIGSTLVFSVTGTTQGTACTISAAVNAEAVTAGGATLQVLPPASALSLANSVIVSSDWELPSGTARTITLTTKDQYGAVFTGPVGAVGFEITSGDCTGTFSSITNVGGGVYTAQFTGVLKGGCHIMARIGGSLISSWAPVMVKYGAFDPVTSTFNPDPGFASNLSDGMVTFVPRDVAGNAIGEPVSDLVFGISNSSFGTPGAWYYYAPANAYFIPISWYGQGTADITASFEGSPLASTVPVYFSAWESSF